MATSLDFASSDQGKGGLEIKDAMGEGEIRLREPLQPGWCSRI